MPTDRERIAELLTQQAIGTPLPFGRPVVRNADGSISTEETMTTQGPGGQWMNVPTIQGGVRLPLAYVEGMAQYGLMPQVGQFGTREEAERAAQARTKVLGPWYGQP